MSEFEVDAWDAVPRADLPTGGGEGPSLGSGTLNAMQAIGTSLASIAPAFSVFAALGLIVGGAGIASPLVVMLAGVGMFFMANTVAEFSRVIPSAGLYPSFLGRAFGPKVGAVTGLIYLFALVLLLTSIIIVVGTWPVETLIALFGVSVPWWLPMIIFTGMSLVLVVMGVAVSLNAAIAFFVFEMVVLIGGAVAMLVTHADSINAAPFNPANILDGTSGLGLAFPLAIYGFLGIDACGSMSEEMENPHKNVRLGVFWTVLIGMLIYTLCAWATIVGFDENLVALAEPVYPFVAGVSDALPGGKALLYLAGLSSALGLLIADLNAYTRIWYNLGREGVLPSFMGAVHGERRTPWLAIIVGGVLVLLMALVSGLAWGPDEAFNYTSTLGTIAVLSVFLAAHVGLPVFYFRHHRDRVKILWHVVFPLVGIVAIGYPLWASVKPGLPSPFNWFGPITLGAVILAALYVLVVSIRQPGRIRVGESFVAEGGVRAEDD